MFAASKILHRSGKWPLCSRDCVGEGKPYNQIHTAADCRNLSGLEYAEETLRRDFFRARDKSEWRSGTYNPKVHGEEVPDGGCG